ncbi:hypothetical protein [Spirosoma panaciterrae]|uniref:hypothetical protein n=1 Tax=Spirosoma panaciterrae TaxID=496058 RepID=UPI000378FC8D|nr:hypothetical protein [Spirosoma panaciterrae]
MKKTEPPSTGQTLAYYRELPAQFTSWNQFYDELIRLGLLEPDTPTIRIKVFRAADTLKDGDSLSVNLLYERQYIERMCLDELRQQRTTQASHLLTSQQVTHLIDLVSNQASKLADWDLLLKLKELLAYEQHQENNRSHIHITSGD